MNSYKGVADIIDSNKSYFKKGDYELILLFNAKKLEIIWKARDNNLGMYCYPTGTYVR